jgi:hypothetical protein
MNASHSYLIRFKWCALAVTAITFLSLMPQLHLWFVRGFEWQGAYAILQPDESLYSAYINALIDGRPRRNDPFAGKDSTTKSPLPESTFSIQFIPSFLIAWLARTCGASASSAFIALIGAAGLLTSLSLFWLFASTLSDSKLAAVGVLVVLCFGALAGGQGLIGLLLKPDVKFLGLPFLRRYQPAAVFPLFFAFCALIWRAVTAENMRSARLHSTLSGLTLGVLVFSYLYLWTAAAAWFGCFAVLWLYLRPRAERRRALEMFAITGAITVLALIPYAYLVSHRPPTLDEAQTLILTHQPDLFRVPEIIGAFMLFALVIGVRRAKIERSESRTIFAASFALVPFVVFNQQLLTGRSMQPFHFEAFAVNYAVLVGLMIVSALLWQPIPSRKLLRIAALCFLWGAIEVSLATAARSRSEVGHDQLIPVLLRLKELSKQDGTLAGLRDEGKASAVVFSPHVGVMGILPTWTPQATLLGMGGLDFGSASQNEGKELLYMYLYYCEADPGRLRELLNERTDDSFMNYYARMAIFGHERIVPILSFHFKPIQQGEIEEEVWAYQAYTDSFSRQKASQHPLTYVITRVDPEPELSHIDRWYERDAGERVGLYNLYRVKLRD